MTWGHIAGATVTEALAATVDGSSTMTMLFDIFLYGTGFSGIDTS